MPVLARRLPADPRAWTDADLLRRVLRSDARGWPELVRRYRALLFRCIDKVLGRYQSVASWADADEVYGDVMLSLIRDDMRKLRLYDPRRGTKLGSWLGLLATNAAYDFLRASSRRPMLDRIDGAPDVASEDEAGPLEELVAAERRAELNQLLADYSDKDRTFVALYYAHGLPAEDVATEMSISVKTVYSKKHKLLSRLQSARAQLATA